MRVLFLAANPSGTAPLQLGREVRTIEDRLRAADLRDTFTLVSHWAVRPSDVAEYLLRHTPHIVHFSGHGTAQGAIVLEDSNGVAAAVSPQALGQLFHALRDNVRCVVLNACFSATQAQAIVNEIDCVVGMAQPVGDTVAI